jgi:uncharacterized protein (DUF433 family)
MVETSVDIGTLITRSPKLRGGRPCIAGTAVTVQRIAREYKMGRLPEEISYSLPHLSLAQIYAALAYYHANKAEIEEDISRDDALYEEYERQYGQPGPEPE